MLHLSVCSLLFSSSFWTILFYDHIPCQSVDKNQGRENTSSPQNCLIVSKQGSSPSSFTTMESTTIAGGGRAANTAGNENDVQDVAKDRLRDANGVTVNLPLQGEATQQQCVDHCVSHSVQSMDSHMIHEQASVEVREEACDLGHSDDLDRADDTAYEDSKEDDGVPFDRGWAWMVVLGEQLLSLSVS